MIPVRCNRGIDLGRAAKLLIEKDHIIIVFRIGNRRLLPRGLRPVIPHDGQKRPGLAVSLDVCHNLCTVSRKDRKNCPARCECRRQQQYQQSFL